MTKTRRTYEENTLRALARAEQERGYAAWCCDGFDKERGRGGIPKTNAEIDAEMNEMLQHLHIEGVEVGHEEG